MAISKTVMKVLQSCKAVQFLVKLVILYEKWISSQVYLKTSTRDGANNFIDKLFLKGTLSLLRQFLAAESPLKIIKMLFILP